MSRRLVIYKNQVRDNIKRVKDLRLEYDIEKESVATKILLLDYINLLKNIFELTDDLIVLNMNCGISYIEYPNTYNKNLLTYKHTELDEVNYIDFIQKVIKYTNRTIHEIYDEFIEVYWDNFKYFIIEVSLNFNIYSNIINDVEFIRKYIFKIDNKLRVNFMIVNDISLFYINTGYTNKGYGSKVLNNISKCVNRYKKRYVNTINTPLDSSIGFYMNCGYKYIGFNLTNKNIERYIIDKYGKYIDKIIDVHKYFDITGKYNDKELRNFVILNDLGINKVFVLKENNKELIDEFLISLNVSDKGINTIITIDRLLM